MGKQTPDGRRVRSGNTPQQVLDAMYVDALSKQLDPIILSMVHRHGARLAIAAVAQSLGILAGVAVAKSIAMQRSYTETGILADTDPEATQKEAQQVADEMTGEIALHLADRIGERLEAVGVEFRVIDLNFRKG